MIVRYSGVTSNYDPVSWNTNITIRGLNLDVGHQPAVKIGDALCRIQRKNSTHLERSWDAVARDLMDLEKEVILRIDGVRVPFQVHLQARSRRHRHCTQEVNLQPKLHCCCEGRPPGQRLQANYCDLCDFPRPGERIPNEGMSTEKKWHGDDMPWYTTKGVLRGSQ
ncbi:hypothetical protein V5799_009633 [Amblyomma americanum]|uniref:IPT/TIG domain-containing protein n=1 Tax=Amblyomma americanum TaxID=6943 RepID=A0AAQ4FBN4_AMBAM